MQQVSCSCMIRTTFAILTRKSRGTQTTISFVCKTGLTGRFVLAGDIGASILKTEKETQNTYNYDFPCRMSAVEKSCLFQFLLRFYSNKENKPKTTKPTQRLMKNVI